MISSEVQRTLVKSPPELWAELSDPAALARHLGELGQIRIVRVQPETAVEWEADSISGTVTIKPSGWGTKVTLSATRQPAAELESTTDDEAGDRSPVANAEVPGAATPSADPAGTLVPSPQTSSPETPSAGAPSAEAPVPSPEAPASQATATAPDDQMGAPEEQASALEPEAPQAEQHAPETRREGLFSRLFRRKRKPDPTGEPATTRAANERPDCEPAPTLDPAIAHGATVEPPAYVDADDTRSDEHVTARSESREIDTHAFAAVSAALAPEAIAASGAFSLAAECCCSRKQATEPASETGLDDGGRPSGDISAELKAAEEAPVTEVTAEQVTAVLTAVLDRLGAAHHRPFSRA